MNIKRIIKEEINGITYISEWLNMKDICKNANRVKEEKLPEFIEHLTRKIIDDSIMFEEKHYEMVKKNISHQIEICRD